MCVDDNQILGEALERWLSKQPDLAWAGWVGDSNELERRVRESCPDVALLDVDMPDRDGFGLLGQLRSACPGVQVVMFSGHLRPDYVDRAFDGGAAGYLSKDDSLEEIVDALRGAAAGKWVMSEAVKRMATGPR